MRVLVCGGRDFDEVTTVQETLDRILAKYPDMEIVHGGARGADSIAAAWAEEREVCAIREPARWKKHGKGAGPIRNQLMLDKWFPDAVVAFRGGAGTKDMVERADTIAIPIWKVGW